MLGYIAKLFNTVLPSILATVGGAYLVNYYVLPKPPAAEPPAISAPAVPVKAVPGEAVEKALSPDKSDLSVDRRERKTQPEPRKAASPVEKGKDKPLETGSREKPAEKPAAEKVNSAKPAQPSRDVTNAEKDKVPSTQDLLRAAIERQRAQGIAPKADESAGKHEAASPAVITPPQPVVAQPQPVEAKIEQPKPQIVQPLPPPVTLAPVGQSASGEDDGRQVSRDRDGDARREVSADAADQAPRPPSGIPEQDPSGRLDPVAPRGPADDMLSAAKSVLQSVIPR